MNAYQEFVDAAERYERLYWALKAQKALGKTVNMWSSNNVSGGYGGRRLVTPSTLPKEREMGEWERAALSRQREAVDGYVDPKDVAQAKAAMTAAKKALKPAQLALRAA